MGLRNITGLSGSIIRYSEKYRRCHIWDNLSQKAKKKKSEVRLAAG
jgi:hypothetical protein